MAVQELVGWKAIAEYLSVCEHTAMRWARLFEMPVYKVMGSVCADPVRLIEWRQKIKRKWRKI